MKIAILGYSGSGKSTLARAIAKKTGFACLHLDSVHFLPGWVEKADEQARAEVRRRNREALAPYAGKVVRLSSQRAIDRFLAEFPASLHTISSPPTR